MPAVLQGSRNASIGQLNDNAYKASHNKEEVQFDKSLE